MTRRERLARKAERRRQWAQGAATQAERRERAARTEADGIPLGQPILIGHHSEKRHRRALERIQGNFEKAHEASTKAHNHASKADGIERQLERSIYSDDTDALERLEEKAQALEAKRDRMKWINSAWRRSGRPAFDNDAGWRAVLEKLSGGGSTTITWAELSAVRLGMKHDPLNRGPFPDYALQNIGATIRQARARAQRIERDAERIAEAEAAPEGFTLKLSGEYATLTFPEYPGRETIRELKAAGFWWSRPCWHGTRKNLPQRFQPAEEAQP